MEKIPSSKRKEWMWEDQKKVGQNCPKLIKEKPLSPSRINALMLRSVLAPCLFFASFSNRGRARRENRTAVKQKKRKNDKEQELTWGQNCPKVENRHKRQEIYSELAEQMLK